MIEIKILGRGGQGAVTASQILAIAAFHDNKESQAFPHFGVERRGAPAMAFTRIDDKQINLRSHVYNPDIVLVLDASLLEAVNATEGLKSNGTIIVNSHKKPKELDIKGNFNIKTVDATSVALDIFKSNIVNTVILGAFAKVTKLISLDSINKAIEERFKGKDKLIDLNKGAVKQAYEKTQ